jgi:nicotinate (nicotinamide) nucleotide adenylyltransferase
MQDSCSHSLGIIRSGHGQKRIGVYGGSFNPIHKAHVQLGRTLLSKEGLDEVWYMVSPQNPLKSQLDLLDDEKRLKLVRLALRNEPGLKACDYEFHLPRPSYTFDTLQALSADYPDCKFTLLIGGDNWADFHRWYRYKELIALYDIVVYPRKDSAIDELQLPPTVRVLHTPLLDISSTDIRQRIRNGQPFRSLLPHAVADFIDKEGWYLGETSNSNVNGFNR